MKHLHFVFILFSTVFTSSVFAQIGQERWNRAYTELDANAEFKEVIETSSGVLLAVGYIEENKVRKGLLVTINVLTGGIIAKKTFSADEDNAKECVFNAVVESGDASFYLVGYRQIRANVKRAWLLHLDENLQALNGKNGAFFPNEKDKESDNVFEKVACLNDGTCMIAGISSGHKSGDVWLFAYKNNKSTLDMPFRKGKFKDIRALIADENRVWLCGNSDDEKKAALFYSIDKDGAIIDNAVCDMSRIDNFSTEINNFSLTVQGNLMMTGKWKGILDRNNLPQYNRQDDKEICLYRFENGQIVQINTNKCNTSQDDNACLICPKINEQNEYFLCGSAGNEAYQIYNLGKNEVKQLAIIGLNKPSFVRMFSTLKKPLAYILVLNEEIKSKKTPRIMAFNANQSNYLASKGSPSFTIQNTVLQDDGDRCLSPQERGFIQFTLSADPNEGIAQGAEVNAQIENPGNGISIVRASQSLREVPPGGRQTVSIPIKANENCQSGITSLRITVTANGKAQFVLFDLCSKEKEKQVPNIFIVPSEELRKSSTKNEKSAKLTGKVYSSNRLANKPILNHNGTDITVELGKAQSKWIDKGVINGQYEYDFSIPVELREDNKGKNTFIIKVGGVESSKIEIQYAKEFNLHVVGIGVPDALYGLKYTANDAVDFVNGVSQQAKNGFFNDVMPYLLNTKETTTKAEITKLFGTLLKKFQNGEIKKDDYLMILISSHGRIKGNEHFGLLPSDYDPNNEDATDIDYAVLVSDFLAKIGCKRFVFIDACHSGKDSGKGLEEEMLSAKINAAYNANPELVSFNSCSKSQRSFEYPLGENGVFTQGLLDILTTKSSNQGQFIRIEDVEKRLKSQMDIYLKEINKQQTPECILNNQTPDLTLFYIPAKK
jgi:hypothetical protein